MTALVRQVLHPEIIRPFSCVAADPPWKLGDSLGKRGAKAKYRVMDVGTICRFRLPPIADDAYLFLWRLASMQEEALRVVLAWGFEVKSEVVWRKLTKEGKPWFGMGHHVRCSHETAIVAVRGKPKRHDASIRSLFRAPVPTDADGNYIHSAKPEFFYTGIVQPLVGPVPRVELFARRRRDGWTSLGNQVPKL